MMKVNEPTQQRIRSVTFNEDVPILVARYRRVFGDLFRIRMVKNGETILTC